MLLEVFFSLYFLFLFLFSLSRHCLFYCVLLVLKSLVAGLICYTLYGFRWYSLLLCLVYVGGVYILFIFVSIFKPKDNFVKYGSMIKFNVVFMFVFRLLCMFFVVNLINIDFRNYLCTCMEGNYYVFLCLTLLFGFIMLRLIFSMKMKFYR